MTDEYRTLRHNINMLGRFLGETINDAQGEDILTLIENVRQLSKQSRAGDSQARKHCWIPFPPFQMKILFLLHEHLAIFLI